MHRRTHQQVRPRARWNRHRPRTWEGGGLRYRLPSCSFIIKCWRCRKKAWEALCEATLVGEEAFEGLVGQSTFVVTLRAVVFCAACVRRTVAEKGAACVVMPATTGRLLFADRREASARHAGGSFRLINRVFGAVTLTARGVCRVCSGRGNESRRNGYLVRSIPGYHVPFGA